MRRKEFTAWAIKSPGGDLYHYNVERTRLYCIAYHAWNMQDVTDGVGDQRTPAWSVEAKRDVLTPGQKKSWSRCRRRGHRCVKVIVREAA